MKYFILDERFGSGSESVIVTYVAQAQNSNEVIERWQDRRSIENNDEYETITNEGNMYKLIAVEEIEEIEFDILGKYLIRLWY